MKSIFSKGNCEFDSVALSLHQSPYMASYQALRQLESQSINPPTLDDIKNVPLGESIKPKKSVGFRD